MIPTYFNRTSALGAMLLAIACAPASSNKQGAESTTVARTDTAAVAAVATAAALAPQDSNVTRADLARIQGSPTAPVWVIEVSDFQCPYCQEWHDATYPAFRDEFVKTGKVRMAYVNFPLAQHQRAWPTAEAAMCAGAQGKFWEMHDAVFATQARWESMPAPETLFDSLAKSTGVDVARWRNCIKAGTMKPLIQADHDRAAAAGTTSTPSFMIGNQILSGAQPIEALRRAIDSAMVTSRKPAP